MNEHNPHIHISRTEWATAIALAVMVLLMLIVCTAHMPTSYVDGTALDTRTNTTSNQEVHP